MNGWLAEQGDVQHRPLLPLFDHDERDEQGSAADQRAKDQAAAPAVRVTAQDSEDDQEQRSREAHEPRNVGATGVDVTRFRHPSESQEQREDPDRDVHVEDPAPPGRVGEDASDQGPGCDRRTDGSAPDRERPEALGTAVLMADQGQGRREERGAPHSLERPREIEHA